jgi:hypothetical protein
LIKFWLYIPDDNNLYDNNLLLIPIIYNNYILSYNKHIQNNKINYTQEELDLKLYYKNSYISLYKKIKNINYYYSKLSNDEIII